MLLSKTVFDEERNSINICGIEQTVGGGHGQDFLKQKYDCMRKVLRNIKESQFKTLSYARAA